MERKTFVPVDLKLDGQGTVRVAFAQLGVVDRDGDVTWPGAFPTKDVPMSGYGHSSWSGGLPTGRGRIAEQGSWAIFDGRFFLDTAAGRDTYETVKGMAELQQWSYGYEPVEYDFGQRDGRKVRNLRRVNVFEVSPVIVGAGIGTHTQLIKTDSSGNEGERLILRALHAIRSGDEAAAQEGMLALQVHREELRARALGVPV